MNKNIYCTILSIILSAILTGCSMASYASEIDEDVLSDVLINTYEKYDDYIEYYINEYFDDDNSTIISNEENEDKVKIYDKVSDSISSDSVSFNEKEDDYTPPTLPESLKIKEKNMEFDMNEYLEGGKGSVSWNSSNPKIVFIDKETGKGESLNNGSSTITAYFDNGDSVSTEIKVNFPVLPYDGLLPSHSSLGVGQGAMPGRVTWEHNPGSVTWDGIDFWWRPSNFNEPVIQDMVNDGIANLGGADNVKDGWNNLFTAHNSKKGNTRGYTTGEKIAIKCNMNGSGFYNDDASGNVREGYSNPVVVKCLLTSLVVDGGVPANMITIYDAGRIFPSYMVDMCTTGVLQGVNIRQREPGGPNDAGQNTDAPVNWSYEFEGAPCYYPNVVTEATYIIDLACLKGHSYGVTLCAKNHFGSYVNYLRSRVPQAAGVHRFLENQNMRNYSPLVDLMGSYQLGEKTVLYMLDGIIVAPGESVEISKSNSTWRMPPFNNYYTSSLFFSQDPVAIDSVGVDFLTNEPSVTEMNNSIRLTRGIENYLHEAALANAAPSGTLYQNGLGVPMQSLGVHEHWNNKIDKEYSRNLGQDEGIELIYRGMDKSPLINEYDNKENKDNDEDNKFEEYKGDDSKIIEKGDEFIAD